MNRSEKNWQHFLEIGILLIAILLSIQAASAFSTLSLSRVDFSSNDAQLNKPAWLLTVVEDGNSQSATGTISHTQVTRSDGATAKNDLTINIQNTQNTCQYTFQNSYTPVYNVNMQVASSGSIFDPSWYNTQQKYANLAGNFAYAYTYDPPASITGYCFLRTTTALISPLSTPTTQIQSTINVAVNGETVSGTVNNLGQKSVLLGTRVYASWSGNLVSGAQCPAPLDSQITGIKQNGNFLIVDKAAADQYNPNQDDLTACAANKLTTAQMQTCINNANARANAVLVKTSRAPFATATISGGQASISQPNLLQYPVITMRVDADWLGIYLPVGVPKIVSVSSPAFAEASTGTVTATVQNVGDSSASFAIGMSCGSPATFTGTVQTITLAKGATQSVNLPLSGVANGKQVDATCTVTAQDVNNPANKDSKSVTVTIKPLAICQAGQQRCNAQTVEICNAAGTLWTQSEVCPNGCQLTNGIAACVIANKCSANTDCPAISGTKAECSGGNCRYTPVTTFDLGKYGKIILWTVLFALFTGLALWLDNKWWYIGSGISSIGLVIGFFSLFSLFAAWMFAIALVAIIAGVGLFAADLMGAAIVALACGALFIIFAIMAITLTLPSWLGWL